MQLGMIGLGRMGANMVRRLLRAGHECVVFDRNTAAVQALAKEKATGVGSVADLVRGLRSREPSGSWCPRPPWMTRSRASSRTWKRAIR